MSQERSPAAMGEQWRSGPGSLAAAVGPVVEQAGGAWIGWSGSAGPAAQPFVHQGAAVVPVPLSVEEIEDCWHGFGGSTLWPLYHDVIVAPEFHRHWWDAYLTVNERFAAAAARCAEDGAVVWVHDYLLQLVPTLLRRSRPDLRIGFFSSLPFPGYEIFAQLPWRRRIVTGILGADLVGFQRTADTTNFLRACRRAAGLATRGDVVWMVDQPAQDSTTAGRVSSPGSRRAHATGRPARVGAFPESVDLARLDELARSADVGARARQIRAELGGPETVFLAVDRLDHTTGILHRLKAYQELVTARRLGPPRTALVQVAVPGRERSTDYRSLRQDVQRAVARINGAHPTLGQSVVHYLHHDYSPGEVAALYRAADVMLSTPLRDGMSLVAKEYVACRYDETGALVLSEFSGAADELGGAFLVNPHDVDGLKDALLRAFTATPAERRRRMRSMRKRLRTHDVTWWATTFLRTLREGTAGPGG